MQQGTKSEKRGDEGHVKPVAFVLLLRFPALELKPLFATCILYAFEYLKLLVNVPY